MRVFGLVGVVSCLCACASASATVAPTPTASQPQKEPAVSGPPMALEAEVVRRGVQSRYDGVRTCYERGLAHSPQMRGRVIVRFVIARDGSVSSVEDAGSTLPDTTAIACVLDVFRGLVFPQPSGRTITIVYPMQFEPDEVDR